MTVEHNDFLNIKDAAKDIGCGERWLRDGVNHGGFPHDRYGKALWFSRKQRDEIRAMFRVPAQPNLMRRYADRSRRRSTTQRAGSDEEASPTGHPNRDAGNPHYAAIATIRQHQKPPPGFVFIEDYVDDDGTTLPGIASRLGVSVGTYKKWRMAGTGPRTTKHGKRVMARVEAVDAYLTSLDRDIPALSTEMPSRTARFPSRAPVSQSG